MRIEVSGSALHVERLRAYAEYRVFSQLAAFAHQVKTVRVVLSPTSCVISAELKSGSRIKSRSRGTQLSRAIDSAATKLAEATSNRLRASDEDLPARN